MFFGMGHRSSTMSVSWPSISAWCTVRLTRSRRATSTHGNDRTQRSNCGRTVRRGIQMIDGDTRLVLLMLLASGVLYDGAVNFTQRQLKTA